FVGLLGAASVVVPAAPPKGAGGGFIGSFLAHLFLPLVGAPATFVLLLAIGIVGVLLAFNLRLRDLMAPIMRLLRYLGVVAAGVTLGGAPGAAGTAVASATPATRIVRDPDDITDASDSPPTRERIAYVLPPLNLLDAVVEPATFGGDEVVHQRNEEIIRKKL